MPETVSAYRNITYRLLPGSRSNAKQLAGLAGVCRFVWNAILAEQSEAYKKAKEAGEKPPSVSCFSLGKRFTALRRTVEWLPEYSFIAPADGLCSTDIVVLGAREPKWSAFVAHTSQTSTGKMVPRISWQSMNKYDLSLPTDGAASACLARIAPMLRRIVGNIRDFRLLVSLRDTLLPKLISGELRLAEAKRVMEAEE